MPYPSLAPYLFIRDAARAMDFYTRAFGAVELLRVHNESGLIMHAEMRIGDSVIMLTDDSSDTADNAKIHLHFYVEDAEAVVKDAVAAGATLIAPVEQKPGDVDRRGGVRDPFGFTWWISTEVEHISREELQKRLNPR